MARLGIHLAEGAPAAGLAASSRAALDRPLAHAAELLVAVPGDDAVVVGAFQRRADAGEAPALPLLTRGSGGAAARVGGGTVWTQLALARPDALVACDAERILNRYVRPLLRALTRTGAQAHWFGRDWVSVARRPAALVAFAHDAATGRALIEAIVAVTTPFALGERGSFRGQAPGTLEEIVSRADVGAVARAIEEAYAELAGEPTEELDPARLFGGDEAGPQPEPPWTAVREEAIGIVAAGRDRAGRLRVGGELMASRDAIARLEDRVAALAPGDRLGEQVGAAVNETLAGAGAVTFGVRSLESVRDVVVAALAPSA